MAKRIAWTHRAQRERREILAYWIERNKSTSYSKKLNETFKNWVVLLSKRPWVGRKTDIEHVRVKIVKDYLIFYEVIDDTLYVLSIWDSRQNPDKLEIKGSSR
jgi:plasmid stabilization system protein ParE